MADADTDPATVAGMAPPVGQLPIYSTADLVNSPEGVKMLAGAGSLTRSPAGGFKLQIQLQEDKSNSAPPSVTAGSPLRALSQDTVSKDLGISSPDAKTVNALAAQPASPIGTISSPYIASDSQAKLISSMSDIYRALQNTQKYTNQSYANYLDQEFTLTTSQLQSINEQYDGQRQRLLGALAAANMALIGAVVSAGVNLAVSAASLMSPSRKEGDESLQPEGAQRERSNRPPAPDQRPESDESLNSSLTLRPQEVEAHIDPMVRGNRAQPTSDATHAPKAPDVAAPSVGGAGASERTEGVGDEGFLEESTMLRSGDNLTLSPERELAGHHAALDANKNELASLQSRAQELKDERSKLSGSIEQAQSSLTKVRGDREANEKIIDGLQGDLGAISTKRADQQSRSESLKEERSRLQSALDALKSDLDPSALEGELQRLNGQKADLQKERAALGDRLAGDQESLKGLEQQRGKLGDEFTSLQNAGRGLANQKGELDEALLKLEEAKKAIDPKVAALFKDNPNLANLFAKKPGSAPNRLEINESDSKLTSMGSNSALSRQTRMEEMAKLHGRPNSSHEYSEWNKGLTTFMKNHGEGTKKERKETLTQFNEAWLKGVDLNKIEQKLTMGKTFVSPVQLDADIERTKGALGKVNSDLERHKIDESSISDRLTTSNRQIETTRSDIAAKENRLADLKREIDTGDQQIGRVNADRAQLSAINQSRDELSDRIAQNRADQNSSDSDLQKSNDLFTSKSKELSARQTENQKLMQARGDLFGQMANAKAAQAKVDREAAGLDDQRTVLIQRRGELEQAQRKNEEEIAQRMSALADEGSSTAALSAQIPGTVGPSDETAAASRSPVTGEIEPVAPSQATSGEILPQSVQGSPFDQLTLDPESGPATDGAATRASGGGGGDEPSGVDSKLKRNLDSFRQLISNPRMLDFFNDAGTRSGDIITQMGLIYKAQAAIGANVLLSGAEQGEAYIETSRELLERLLDETLDNSKDLDKQMGSLLDVMTSISKNRTDMYNSLFLG